MTRTEDFLALKGKDVSFLAGAEVSELRLYSCAGRGCSLVPVQVDKVDVIGRYVFPQDLNLDRDGRVLDDNDEILFMASDAGDRIPPDWRPEGAARGVEIELLDPLDQGRGWLYLFDQPGSPVPDLPDYVDYLLEGETVFLKSPQFNLGYLKGNMGYGLIRALTPSGELGPNILDRQRVGIEAEMAGDVKIPVNVPEGIVRTHDVGVIDGPIRVIVDQEVTVHLGEVSFDWKGENFNNYYRCGQNNSVYFSFPVSANDIVKTILFNWSLDFTPDVLGSSYLDPNQSAPLLIEDKVQKEVPNDAPHFWWGLYGPKGTLLQALDLDDYMLPYFTCEGRWRQNPNPRVRKGDQPGRLEIGFGCHEIGSIPERNDYHWLNYVLFPEDPSPQGLLALRKIFEHPLEVKVANLP